MPSPGRRGELTGARGTADWKEGPGLGQTATREVVPITHLSSSFLQPDSHRGPQRHFTPKQDVFSRETPLGQKLLDPRGRSPGRWICRASIETILWKNCFVACNPEVRPRRPDAGNQGSGGERMGERQAQGRGE